jgi:cupin 2 domain-containing protein
VVLLEGSATIEFESKPPVHLERGDTLLIPAHERHCVAYTTTEPACIWLCVFMKE